MNSFAVFILEIAVKGKCGHILKVTVIIKWKFRSKLSWKKPIRGKKPIKVKVGGLVFGNGVKIITFFLVH